MYSTYRDVSILDLFDCSDVNRWICYLSCPLNTWSLYNACNGPCTLTAQLPWQTESLRAIRCQTVVFNWPALRKFEPELQFHTICQRWLGWGPRSASLKKSHWDLPRPCSCRQQLQRVVEHGEVICCWEICMDS